MAQTRHLAFLLCAAPTVLMAAAPAPEGGETLAHFGGGRWMASSANGPGRFNYDYTALEAGLSGSHRHRFDSGLTLAGEATLAPAVITGLAIAQGGTWVDPRWDTSDGTLTATAAARVGFHTGVAGVEAGAFVNNLEGKTAVPYLGNTQRALLPSAVVWAGLPAVHAFGRTAAGPTTGVQDTLVVAGVGHTSDLVRIEAGGWQGVGNVVFDLKTATGLRVGADVAYSWADDEGDKRAWRGLVRVAVLHRNKNADLY